MAEQESSLYAPQRSLIVAQDSKNAPHRRFEMEISRLSSVTAVSESFGLCIARMMEEVGVRFQKLPYSFCLRQMPGLVIFTFPGYR